MGVLKYVMAGGGNKAQKQGFQLTITLYKERLSERRLEKKARV